MKRVILFQGDSITFAGRDLTDPMDTGKGYAKFVKASLNFDFPGVYEFYNRGIGGNRVVDLYARIKRDMINIKPDYMSILIGVNDVWHEYRRHDGVDVTKYEMIYNLLIEELKAALPDLKIMIMEPFCLPGTKTESTEEWPDRWEYFRSEVDLRSDAAKRVAQKYSLPFLPLQNVFDEACKLQPAAYWLSDGVHPTEAGHELIKREWLKMFPMLTVDFMR